MLISQLLAYLDKHSVEYTFCGEPQLEITQVAALDKALAGEVSFLNDPKYASHLENTNASLVIVAQDVECEHCSAVIKTANPYYVYALIAQALNPAPSMPEGIASSAQIHTSANIAQTARIDHAVVIQEEVVIGEKTEIQAGSVIQKGARIGSACRIGANVVIAHDCIVGDNTNIEAGAVIGGDGFGWANHQGHWVKIPQVGRVVIGHHVSIGNNACIDRGAIADTIIADNCIIDNLVHIAHNCEIGYGSAIAGQTGFAGSTILGKHCTVAGQVGFSGHIEIADNCHFLAKTGVTHNLKEAGAYAGFPAVKAADWQKTSVRVRQLDKLSKKIKQLEKELANLTS